MNNKVEDFQRALRDLDLVEWFLTMKPPPGIPWPMWQHPNVDRLLDQCEFKHSIISLGVTVTDTMNVLKTEGN
jgi:hypothetical protein